MYAIEDSDMSTLIKTILLMVFLLAGLVAVYAAETLPPSVVKSPNVVRDGTPETVADLDTYFAEPNDLPYDEETLAEKQVDGWHWRQFRYTSLVYGGEPIRIHAVYAAPDQADAAHPVPAILMTHGIFGAVRGGDPRYWSAVTSHWCHRVLLWRNFQCHDRGHRHAHRRRQSLRLHGTFRPWRGAIQRPERQGISG